MEKYNVLIADDDKEIAASIELFLKAEGYNVYTVYDGLEALDIVMSNDIHLLILDIMMPGMDGFTLCRKIRERESVPVLFLMENTISQTTSVVRSTSISEERKPSI